jgi:hypothetical protein
LTLFVAKTAAPVSNSQYCGISSHATSLIFNGGGVFIAMMQHGEPE